MSEIVLKINNLRKSFSGVEVLHAVDMEVLRGQVTALVGENGAGKSTLMKILMGEHLADEGSIELEGETVRFTNSHQALAHGICMIFQEMSPFPELTVAQNIFAGREPSRFGFVNDRQMRKQAQALLENLGIHLDVNRKVKTLTVSETQLLEIAKAISYDSKIVIMDEPTSALTGAEVRLLFDIIARIKEKGVSIIYISHKLDELFEIADRVCVLRDGSLVSMRPIAEVQHATLINEMVGRTIDQLYPTVEKEIGKPLLRVEKLYRKGAVEDVSFEIRSGEILGFAGMVGAGRTELVNTLFGIDKYQKGDIYVNDEKVRIKSPRDAVSHGFALVPEDRGKEGLSLGSSIKANMCATILDTLRRKLGFTNRKKEAELTDDMAKKMHIKMVNRNQITGSLSGGNQQKIVVGKWLLTHPNIVFMDEPTRGIDVGAKYEIYQLIQDLAKEGKAVLIISSEMPELLGICDRILVLKEGRIVGELDAKNANQDKIMAAIVDG